MLQGICITLASHESVTVSHVTILYVEAVQESLSIKPVIVGGIVILKFTRPIPNQGPVQLTGEVTGNHWYRVQGMLDLVKRKYSEYSG